jgi:hypothetical protein
MIHVPVLHLFVVNTSIVLSVDLVRRTHPVPKGRYTVVEHRNIRHENRCLHLLNILNRPIFDDHLDTERQCRIVQSVELHCTSMNDNRNRINNVLAKRHHRKIRVHRMQCVPIDRNSLMVVIYNQNNKYPINIQLRDRIDMFEDCNRLRQICSSMNTTNNTSIDRVRRVVDRVRHSCNLHNEILSTCIIDSSSNSNFIIYVESYID